MKSVKVLVIPYAIDIEFEEVYYLHGYCHLICSYEGMDFLNMKVRCIKIMLWDSFFQLFMFPFQLTLVNSEEN
jgi:hypothetical protein